MTRYDIPWEDHYIGVWIGKPSRELRIRKISPRRYLATLLINGNPIGRPWMNDEPTVDMPATYSFSAMDGPDFSVHLWKSRRFAISLDYQPHLQIYDGPPCEALTMGITQDSKLDFLDQYYGLLGGMEHFVRSSEEDA